MEATEIFTALLAPEGRADPYPLYAALHELGEAVAVAPGVVVVHGYEAISAMLRDPAFLVSDAARMKSWVASRRSRSRLPSRENTPAAQRRRVARTAPSGAA